MAEETLHLVIVDGLNPTLLRQELAALRLPAFAHLVSKGMLREAVSTFPTVTPTCLASLATGLPPAQHGIHGIMWWNACEERYVHYWPSPQSLVAGTFGQVMRDILQNLNTSHLSRSASTVFELLEGAGIESACVNFPISRGPFLRRAHVPLLVALLGSLPARLAISGPRQHYVGDLLRPLISLPQGLLGRYGISDARATRYTQRVVQQGEARFILTYLPDNDLFSHKYGPLNVGRELQVIDRRLGQMMSAYGSWEEATRRARWIVIGDHAQTDVGGFVGYSVNVFTAFRSVQPVPFGRAGRHGGPWDVAIAPNDRSAQITAPDQDARRRAITEMLTWPSVDRLLGKEPDGWFWAQEPQTGRVLRFRPDGPWHDLRGGSWQIEGDPEVLDLRESGLTLREGVYPDALYRVTGSLGSADFIATAKPGWEFTTGFSMGHGNHGSLRDGDSKTALVAVGVD
ncbi:MAG: alkaline phosphatase family protein, partial [Cyanobacteria bacterium REEB65]|nr:alkaline phosphatase family protein [Cyanobacteria bacterium REEB65]